MVGKITGEFGAHGKQGGEAISDRLTELAGGIKSSAMSERGLEARLKYLTNSPAGYQAMERAGISVTPRTLIAWLSGDRDPNKANRGRLDAAYADLRRRNVAKNLKNRLNNNGRGTRVEVHPITQAGVTPSRQRALEVRKVNIRPSQWDRLVDLWAAGDVDAMNDEWEDIAEDTLGSEWGAYTAVAAIGFGA
ncbi:transcriptional regulator [Streptomyces sp. SCL15-4]|uniref:transcriptional regulator n=1 Tax=Streptomyces sp. SCL15-4 TaxID=2967221 RepID=UPI0029663290|nr:transcriptional regulator [Streptomyces sp. SCL15-4]